MLIVDDDASARTLLTSILYNLGHTDVQAVSDAAGAVQALNELDPDIVFLDLEMPGHSGFDVLPKLVEVKPEMYVVIVTAHSTLENVKQAKELGAGSFIVKPYTIGKIKDALNNYRDDSAGPNRL